MTDRLTDGRTDGQTDGQTDRRTGKNNMSPDPEGRRHNIKTNENSMGKSPKNDLCLTQNTNKHANPLFWRELIIWKR